jgi:AcrR family transcriptional regulator
MGNREDLIAGAKRCLHDKGYARTTARDIATAAGTSLAAIGYHFGSKDALMSIALIEASGTELGDEIEHAISDADSTAEPLERFATTWTNMIESFAAHRPLISANFENLAQVDHLPQVRVFLVQAQQQAVSELARLLQEVDNTLDGDSAPAVGSLYYTLLNGLMVQWLIDPATTPTGRDLADALRALAHG